MIVLEKITIEGFGSIIRKITFNLNEKGLNIMRGKIGSGKTSIPSSLYWCFYGKTLKKGSTVETWSERRGVEYRGTMTRVYFTVDGEDYSIIRCINFKGYVMKKVKGNSKLILLKGGVDISNKGKVSVQQQIQNLIGYSPDLFINSIIYGQRLKRIIEETGPNKKKLFDEAFETIFIEKAKIKADGERAKVADEISNIESTLEYTRESIETTTRAYDSLLKAENSFENNKKRMMREYKANIQGIKLKIKRVRSDLKKLPHVSVQENTQDFELVESYKTKLLRIAELSKTAKNWELEIELLRENKHNTKGKRCFECKSIINEKEHKKMLKKIDDRIAKLEKDITSNRNLAKKFNIDEINEALQKAEKRIKEYESQMANLKSNNKLKETLERQLSGYMRDLTENVVKYKREKETKIKIESTKYFEDIQKLKKKQKALKKQLEPIQQELERLNWAIKDPLSNSGIKAYIFDNLLSQVNSKLYEYGEILKFRVEFGIDLETNSKDFYQMIYKEELMINYPDLSGGQKQLVDTAVALALHSVISNVRPINLLFLDEVFEGLDPETIDLVMELISYIARKKAVYLITHNQLFQPNNAREISFQLDENDNTILS